VRHASKRRQKLRDQAMLFVARIMLKQPSISLYGEKTMNQFKQHDDLYDPKLIAPQLRKDFHQENTAPHPIVPKPYPVSWDKRNAKKLPSLHQTSETILSNRHYVIACTVIMSTIFFIYIVKLLFTVIVK
jgi:hypothetical protein